MVLRSTVHQLHLTRYCRVLLVRGSGAGQWVTSVWFIHSPVLASKSPRWAHKRIEGIQATQWAVRPACVESR
ncbi:hypothetical protein FOMPIDRAFT_94849 [Fomitopsis schrenkii]|uniref:Uncharacterized protein n=1 Tax=Fomitopsis schrenkii TaxID=2126942 RepID=S8EUW5_FOMSC|nr:hypothetical protein FOMPIDRAFT_94849 [Fomitopsis schrenkii]